MNLLDALGVLSALKSVKNAAGLEHTHEVFYCLKGTI